MAKNLQWYIEKYGNVEGNKRHEEIRKKIGSKSKNRNTLHGFVSRYGEEEGRKRYNDFVFKSRHTKKGYIDRYGEKDGLIKWEKFVNKKTVTSIRRKEYWISKGYSENEAKELIKKIQSTRLLDSYINRLGEEEGTKEYFRINTEHAFKISLEGFIEKYGEFDGRSKFKKYCLDRGRTKEQLIEQYGKERATELIQSRIPSLSNYIKWYGEEEGNRKYIEKYKNNNLSSKQARQFFVLLYKQCRKLGLNRKDIYFSITGSSEWFLRHESGIYWFDFTIPKLKIMVEFNGEHVHPNINLSNEEKKQWKHAFSKKSFNEVLVNENRKIDTAKNMGFDVLIVWSKSNLTDELKRVLEAINDRLTK